MIIVSLLRADGCGARMDNVTRATCLYENHPDFPTRFKAVSIPLRAKVFFATSTLTVPPVDAAMQQELIQIGVTVFEEHDKCTVEFSY